MSDSYTLGSHTFRSRLIVGTGKYGSYEQQLTCIRESGADLVTVALRRVDLNAPKGKGLLDFLPEGVTVLPNTAGCFNVEDAVTTARLGRELLGHSLVKLEVIGDERTLFPDVAATLEAARILVDDGFHPALASKVDGDDQRCARQGCELLFGHRWRDLHGWCRDRWRLGSLVGLSTLHIVG